jgi:hypothetical protein
MTKRVPVNALPVVIPILSLVALLIAGAAETPWNRLFRQPRAESRVQWQLEPAMRHLRNGSLPEWAEFAASTPDRELVVVFPASANRSDYTLELVQEDVKQEWSIAVNDRRIGTLERDEKQMVVYRGVPAGVLLDGDNELRIAAAGTATDDIRVGRIVLHARLPSDALSEATVSVEVVDAETGAPTPSRITIVDERGALQTVAAPVHEAPGPGGPDGAHPISTRPGFVYTGDGTASFTLPAGTYTLYAGRGFEYGVESTRLALRAGTHARHRFVIRREVPTDGWVASDTHVHTLTYSGHGDATAEERALTIAGEGVELPILTEHNRHADLEPAAAVMGVRPYFTPVTGNEYTTRLGHFNVFPAPAGAPAPDPKVDDWTELSRRIRALPGARIVILNHGRDVHSGFRPLGPERHLSAAGVNRDGWSLPANAMEVINSGAQQSDMLQLFRDWFGLMNAGMRLTPVGSSDSHDVSRYFVGQARTYVRAQDDDPGRIDVAEAVRSFHDGRVAVSFGLLAEIQVDGRYGPGDLAPVSESFDVHVRVLGPSWLEADALVLYANGQRIREAAIEPGTQAGVKWQGSWTIPRPHHDLFLVAIASGPGDGPVFWPIAKPYQPTSPEWHPRVIGATGAVWIDADGDGAWTPARGYAKRLVLESGSALEVLLRLLRPYDEAVALQAAALLYEQGQLRPGMDVTPALAGASSATRRGFELFLDELRADPPSP